MKRLGHKRSSHGRLGRKTRMYAEGFQRLGGALGTAGAVMSATGVGATIGAPLAGFGAGMAGVGAIMGGAEALTRAKDAEDVVDAGVGIVKGAVAAKGGRAATR